MPIHLIEAMDDYISKDTHATRSELIRSSLREKIQRDAPKIWSKVMKKVNAKGSLN